MDDSERMEISISDSEKEEISEPQSKSKEWFVIIKPNLYFIVIIKTLDMSRQGDWVKVPLPSSMKPWTLLSIHPNGSL